MTCQAYSLLAAFFLLLQACVGSNEPDDVSLIGDPPRKASFVIVANGSIAQWRGEVDGMEQLLSAGIKGGHVQVIDSTMVSGELELDMTTLSATADASVAEPDLTKRSERARSADVFNVTSFPKATIAWNASEKSSFTASTTLRGETIDLKFEAISVTATDGLLEAVTRTFVPTLDIGIQDHAPGHLELLLSLSGEERK